MRGGAAIGVLSLRYANALARAVGALRAAHVEIEAVLRTLPPDTPPRHRKRIEVARARLADGLAHAEAVGRITRDPAPPSA